MDRLSELPDSLIFEILWWLPMRDVFRTSVLSNRWQNLWTTLPSLFINDMAIGSDTVRVGKLVNRALMMWRGTKFQKFFIYLDTLDDKSLYGDIDLWLRFAKEHQVKELYLNLGYVDDDRIEEYGLDHVNQTQEEMYCIPQCLYSCRSLQTLTFEGCNLPIPIKNVEWDQLKKLTISGYGLSEDLINRVLCGSPRLEFLKLYVLENHENLSIRSSSLMHLSVNKYLYFTEDIPAMDTELRIWSPNLRRLKILGVPYSKCLINHLPFLTYANLDFYGRGDYSHYLFSGNDFVGETLRQIFPTIQYAQELILTNWSIKGLGVLQNRNMLFSPFLNVNFLKLEYCCEDCNEILHFLGIFPKLERLVLEEKDSSKCKELAKLEANRPDCFLQELKIVVIRWGACGEEEAYMFPFIEILLKYACKLEKMVFRVKDTTPPLKDLVWAFKKLLRMPRSSPNAQLIFS
ncbi:hypothetical protein OROMI_027257 [Orobanche minor]